MCVEGEGGIGGRLNERVEDELEMGDERPVVRVDGQSGSGGCPMACIDGECGTCKPSMACVDGECGTGDPSMAHVDGGCGVEDLPIVRVQGEGGIGGASIVCVDRECGFVMDNKGGEDGFFTAKIVVVAGEREVECGAEGAVVVKLAIIMEENSM